ncbi:type-1 angiotensin II receptor A-like [Physella acuta]|uniref:type-1 angiotensin II receptor A-like n=1 Tax=Physella acuta TaxID=109671 RepID=UPI0027DBAB6E|nr:type-1 angiotensin II receptor A-like [Physella acuta]
MAGTENTSSTSSDLWPEDLYTALVSASTYQMIVLVNIILSSIVSPFGIVFNIVSIIVFIKLGFNESTNISLVSLAVSDIAILLTLVGLTVNSNPMVEQAAASHDTLNAVGYIALGWPNVLATRITGCLTTFLAFERFVCVAWPLKVKTLLTRKTAIKFSVGLYLLTMAYAIPVFVGNSIGLRFNPMSNQTSVGLIVSEKSDVLEGVSRSINIIIEFTSFTLVTGFTSALIYSFKITTKWRSLFSSAARNNQLSHRDRKLVKMVLIISIVFIGCSVPNVTADVVILLVKDYNMEGRERNLFLATSAMFFNMVAINSSMNIFIYLKMSSKFRQAFLAMFSGRKSPTQNTL